MTPENSEVLIEISVLYLKINETQKAHDRLAEVVSIERKCSPKGLLAFGAILQVNVVYVFPLYFLLSRI